MMKEQFLKFSKNKKNFREIVLVILEENIFVQRSGAFFRKNKTEKRKKKKNETKRRRNTEGVHKERWKNTVKEATE